MSVRKENPCLCTKSELSGQIPRDCLSMQVPEGSEGRLLHRDAEQGAGVVAMQRPLGVGAGSASGLGSKTVPKGRM